MTPKLKYLYLLGIFVNISHEVFKDGFRQYSISITPGKTTADRPY